MTGGGGGTWLEGEERGTDGIEADVDVEVDQSRDLLRVSVTWPLLSSPSQSLFPHTLVVSLAGGGQSIVSSPFRIVGIIPANHFPINSIHTHTPHVLLSQPTLLPGSIHPFYHPPLPRAIHLHLPPVPPIQSSNLPPNPPINPASHLRPNQSRPTPAQTTPPSQPDIPHQPPIPPHLPHLLSCIHPHLSLRPRPPSQRSRSRRGRRGKRQTKGEASPGGLGELLRDARRAHQPAPDARACACLLSQSLCCCACAEIEEGVGVESVCCCGIGGIAVVCGCE